MRSLKDRLVDFLQRDDKIDIAYRQGIWCWRNVVEALLAPFKRRLGVEPQPLLLASWSNSALIGLNRRLGFFRLHQVVDGRRLDARGTAHLKIHSVLFHRELSDRDGLFPRATVEWLRQSNHFLLLDFSAETIEPADPPPAVDYFLELHGHLHDVGIDPAKVVLLSGNLAARQHYAQWLRTHPQDRPMHMLGYSHYPFFCHWRIQCSSRFSRTRKHLRALAERTVTEGLRRPRHFMSLNLKVRPHRFALLLHLIERGHLDKGWITFHAEGWNREDPIPAGTPSDLLERLPSGPRLRPKIPDLHARSPITLPAGYDDILKTLAVYAVRGNLEWLIPEVRMQNGDVTQFLSYFEIVTETYFCAGDNLFLTEKIMRPIVRLQPFMCLGPPHMLREMRRLGFKTFSPWIDESYDEVVDPIARMEAIFREIDRLCAMPLDDIHRIYCELWPVISHNYDRYTDYEKIRSLYLDEVTREVIAPLHQICSGGEPALATAVRPAP
jgi:hypothetical protein